jgi:hypothetical protein
MRAYKCTKKEVGLENTLLERWGHKDALEMKKIGPEGAVYEDEGLKKHSKGRR